MEENRELELDETLEDNLDTELEDECESTDEMPSDIDIIKESMRMSREIILDDEEVTSDIINTDKFNKGFTDSLYFCGLYTGLINSGMSNEQAYDMLVNIQTSNHNQEMQRIVNNGQLEIAKTQEDNIKNQSL